MVFYIENGLNSASKSYLDMKHALAAANSVTYTCEYVFKKSQKESLERQAIQRVSSDI